MKDIDVRFDNEREWRKAMWKRMDKIDSKLDSLNFRIAGFGSFFGLLGFFAGHFVIKLF